MTLVRKSFPAAALALVAFAPTVPVHAHHSRSNFAATSIVVRGVVDRVEWQNPHVYFFIVEQTANGRIDWQVEAQSTPGMLRRGWQPSSVTPGETVTLRGNPDRESKPLIFADTITKTDGTTLRVQGPSTLSQSATQRAMSLEGIWAAVGAPFDRSRAASDLPLTAKGRAAAAAFDVRNDPFAECVPPQVPDSLSTPYLHAIEIHANVVLLREEYWEVDRVVYMDGRGHPSGGPRTNQGHSIGHWDGGTLVVDTTLFADHGFGNGSGIPSGAQKHIVERYSVNADQATLTIDYVLEDPEHLREPVRGSRMWRFAPGLEFIPNRCDPANARRYTN